MKDPETIEEYLDELADELQVRASLLRRISAEAEDHLRTTTAALIEGGTNEDVAEIEAMRRFGSPSVVARSFLKGDARLSVELIHHLGISLLGLAGVGLVAIGLNGLVALAMGLAFGKSFVAGDPPGVTYTAERCAEFQEYYKGDCKTAATAHHFDEVVSYRLAAGVLGILACGAYVLLRRCWPRSRLPRILIPTIGASIFGVAALLLTLLGLQQTVFGIDQAGANLSGGLVAAVAFALYSFSLLPALSRQSA
jgi:hypothetical protein